MKAWALVAGLAVLVSACAPPPSGMEVTGTVRDETVTVPVPALSAASVDLDAGFAAAASSPRRPASALVSAVIVQSVPVRLGDHVQVGDTLAVMDDAAQKAALAAAKADASVADAQVGLLAQSIKDADDKAVELADKRADVVKAISTIKSTQKKLAATAKKLAATRKQVAKKLAEVEKALASLPPPGTPVPPGVTLPSRDDLLKAIAQLKAALKQIDAGRKKLASAQKQLKAGLKKAQSGLRTLDTARADLNDARAQLRDLKKLAQVAADGSHVAIDAATWQTGLTLITAPVSGTVVAIVDAGTAHVPGAALAVIRPDGPSLVDAWVTPAQHAALALGGRVDVLGDWMTAPMSGTLSVLGDRATYPPSPTTTDETHLTRAFEITVQASGTLPAGVPVTLTFPK